MAQSPLTLDTLDPQQRMRLVRSTRKLEAVLGTAPYLLDGVYKPRPRQPSPSPTSSISSDSSEDGSFVVVKNPEKAPDVPPKPKAIATELSRPLLLRLRSVPVDTSPRRKGSILPAIDPVSPLSPTFTINLETKEATPAGSLPAVDRRRRLAKLARTFGETVPPELVFGATESAQLKPRQRKRMPFPLTVPPEAVKESAHTRSQSFAPTSRRPSISRPRALSRTSSPQNLISSIVVASPAHVVSPPPRTSSKPTPSLAERRLQPRPRSLTLGAVPSPNSSAPTSTDSPATSKRIQRKPMPEFPPSSSSPTPTPTPTPSSKPQPEIIQPVQTIQVDVSVAHASYVFDLKPSPVDPRLLEVLDVKRSAPESPAPFKFVRSLPDHKPNQHRSHKSESSPASSVSPSTAHHTRSASAVPQRLLGRAGRRKEREWSGEWNQSDMQEVVRKLRGLKAR